MKLAAGDRVATLSRFGSVIKMDAVEPGASYISWATLSSFEFLEAAATHDNIEITEPGDAGAAGRVIRLVHGRTIANGFGVATAMRNEAELTDVQAGTPGLCRVVFAARAT
jgi:hypothetical protein